MIILISHYGNNKGTTDYFRDYLTSKNRPYIYIKNSLPNLNNQQTIVTKYDNNGNSEILSRYVTSKSLLLNTIQTTYYGFKAMKQNLQDRDNLIISFGSINTIPGIFIKFFTKTKVYFWGVDYSIKRFNNVVLDLFYQLTESFACLFADLVIQPNKEQEQARQNNNFLKLKKSLIVSNGIAEIKNTEIKHKKLPISLLYFGSITQQHGINEFIEKVYINNQSQIPCIIFGGGPKSQELKNIINTNNLNDLIEYRGATNNSEMVAEINNSKCNYIGIAPYTFEYQADYVRFCDSLKIKEYLALGIPFLTSSAIPIPLDLQEFGHIYHSIPEVCDYISYNNLFSLIQKIDNIRLGITLNRYLWSEVCKKIQLP